VTLFIILWSITWMSQPTPTHLIDRACALPACPTECRGTRVLLYLFTPPSPPPPALLTYWPCMLPTCRHCYDSVCFSSLLLHHLVRRTTPFSPPLHLASIRAAPCLSLLHPHVHPCHPLLSPSHTHPTDEQQRIRPEVKRWYEWLNKPYEWLSEIF
jgi:hypothetical protein